MGEITLFSVASYLAIEKRVRRFLRRATIRSRRAYRLARKAWRNPRGAQTTRVEIVYTFLDRTLFSWVLGYIKHPLHVLALLFLWAAILTNGQNATLQLLGGNYFNGSAALAACILLIRQFQHHHAQRRETKALGRHIAHLHAKVDALSARPHPSPTSVRETSAPARKRRVRSSSPTPKKVQVHP